MEKNTVQAEKKYPVSREEILNSVTHGAGAFISVAGLVLLIVFASLYGDARHIVSCAIFGFALVLLYTASTLYHSFRKPRVKFVFKIIDHSCIYILIAGTYTPFMLVVVRGALGWTLFGVVWTMTVMGILFKSFFIHRFKILSTLAYILMGWLVIFAAKPIFQSLSSGAIFWLVAGGIIYTVGTVFYAWKKLPFNHAIWHAFVLAGSICHFFAVLFYVIPLKT
ncbi:MAG TPA: hemolysin III family protein [Deltaproteobacteria bacterium]|nr:hemolysin III family protein [Deltaproteobacteria bacterium]